MREGIPLHKYTSNPLATASLMAKPKAKGRRLRPVPTNSVDPGPVRAPGSLESERTWRSFLLRLFRILPAPPTDNLFGPPLQAPPASSPTFLLPPHPHRSPSGSSSSGHLRVPSSRFGFRARLLLFRFNLSSLLGFSSAPASNTLL
ncbi:unnamed protein product [Rangifer tarandus platyrhynchus]|uniref:Uncharacterized protein n=2 Tax=Rangifer tarandus platyrhynchus TaxID=3082113 RepID=A0ACB0FK98_RANTA|nr:unnamed protein product [Rangifer tarandus platyrhynchus]CAI9712923.1 unnamed protein product [Rangifer tarandus platyrhynchus]